MEIIALTYMVEQNHVIVETTHIDLTEKLAGRRNRSRQNLVKGMSAGGKTETIKKGKNRFPASDGDVVFTPIFKDHDKMLVLETYEDFCSIPVANCLMSNLILYIDVKKVNRINCF